jgi:hypothetical protein
MLVRLYPRKDSRTANSEEGLCIFFVFLKIREDFLFFQSSAINFFLDGLAPRHFTKKFAPFCWRSYPEPPT